VVHLTKAWCDTHIIAGDGDSLNGSQRIQTTADTERSGWDTDADTNDDLRC
jgi:hypothetical protein